MVGKLSPKERLVLFALDDEQGYIINSNTIYWVGLAGAVILEMIQKGLIKMDKDCLVSEPNTSNSFHGYQRVLTILEKHQKPLKIESVIVELWASIKIIHDEIVHLLIEKGLLKEVKKRIFWLIVVKRYPALNRIPELGLRKYLLLLVKKDKLPNEEIYLLFRMIYQCELVAEVFGKENETSVMEYITRLKSRSHENLQNNEPIELLESAMLAAIININLQLILEDG
jgi:hypothetical protein